MPGNERYIVPLYVDPDDGSLWLVLLAGDVRLRMTPQSSRPLTCINPQTRANLIEADCLSSSDREFMEDLSINGAVLAGLPFPSIPVEVSDDQAALGVDGILGFDFFARFFTEVNFIFPPHRLILVDP